MTFTIIGREPETGALGVATATGAIAVGAQVPHCRFGVGAIATQGFSTNLLFARHGLPLLAAGQAAPQALQALVEADSGRDYRQLAVMDRAGSTAAWTGGANGDCKGAREAQDLVVTGNILAGEAVLDAMVAAWRAAEGKPLAERLLAALAAGEDAGGDARGTCSAALLVDSGTGAALNLRVDYSSDPLAALQDLHERSKEPDYRDFLQRLPDERDPGRY